MHPGRIVPDEERLAVTLGLVHEVVRRFDQYLIEGGHVVLWFEERKIVHPLHVRHIRERRQWTFINDPLLADLAPPRHHSLIIRFGGKAVDEVRSEERRVGKEGRLRRS